MSNIYNPSCLAAPGNYIYSNMNNQEKSSEGYALAIPLEGEVRHDGGTFKEGKSRISGSHDKPLLRAKLDYDYLYVGNLFNSSGVNYLDYLSKLVSSDRYIKSISPKTKWSVPAVGAPTVSTNWGRHLKADFINNHPCGWMFDVELKKDSSSPTGYWARPSSFYFYIYRKIKGQWRCCQRVYSSPVRKFTAGLECDKDTPYPSLIKIVEEEYIIPTWAKPYSGLADKVYNIIPTLFSGTPCEDPDYDFNLSPDIFFRYNEGDWFDRKLCLCNDYKLQFAINHAYKNALDGAKIMNNNNLQNILSVMELISNLRKGKFEVPKSLSDLWLSYRYSYSTTKMDIEEAIDFIKWTHIMDYSSDFVTRGTCTYEDITCHVKLRLVWRLGNDAKHIWTALYTYGLQPNFYLLWDSLPFSFVVDWFLPMGDVLEIIDSDNYYNDRFDFHDACLSVEYKQYIQTKSLDIDSVCYTRWIEDRMRSLDICYWFEDGQSSDKTILFRCIDAVSLFMGRK